MPSKKTNNIVPKLKRIYQEKGITSCELRLPGCLNNWALGFAHRHKRRWYLGKENLLSDFNQTVLACVKCHDTIEYNKELTDKVFTNLRGGEYA
jgi:hypothetical protein